MKDTELRKVLDKAGIIRWDGSHELVFKRVTAMQIDRLYELIEGLKSYFYIREEKALCLKAGGLDERKES